MIQVPGLVKWMVGTGFQLINNKLLKEHFSKTFEDLRCNSTLVDVLDHLDDHVPVFEEVESMIFEGPFRVLVLCDQEQ